LFADADLIDACTICESHIGQEKLFVKRVWAEVLARMILSRSERAEMAASKLPPLPTAEWLFGRVAAKDAIRRHAQLEMPMADILIGRNESGAPIIQNQLDSPLQLSIAHKGLYGVAVTADSNRVGGIGIDVETLLPLDPALVADSFDEQERTILAQVAAIAGLTQSQAGRAAWAAKEAIGKALGAGLIGGPRSIQITAASEGLFLTRLAGPLQSRYSSQSAPLVAHWRLHGDHALALCVIPREQFLAPLSGDYSRN
jgi:phosphopantetheinyl transferase